MELSLLRAFLLLAENGSFSQTAVLLHLTQPAVSQQIKVLEAEMGQVLFTRSGRSTRLTPAGELFLPYARRVISFLEEGKSLLGEYEQKRGRLLLGAGTTTIIFRLPELLQEYKKRKAGVDLAIKAGSSREITGLVLKSAVDFGLVTTPVPAGKLKSVPLVCDRILLVAPPAWTPPAVPLRLTDLADEPMILFSPPSGFRDFLDLAFRTHHLFPRVVLELDSIEGIKQMVRIGLGISFLPEIAVRTELVSGELTTVPLAGPEEFFRTTFLIYLPEKFWTRAMKEFTRLLSEKYALSPTAFQ